MIELVCIAGGFALGWAIARDHGRRAHVENNARIIDAWITFKRPDVPPITAYRTGSVPSSTEKP